MSLIVVSNREPLQQQNGTWEPSVGGLTTALLPVLQEQGGTWVAWGEERPDEVPRIDYPEQNPVLRVERIKLSDDELDNFYYGFANQTLWPLCHYFTERLTIDRGFWQTYREINHRFVGRTDDVYEPGDTVWIHDYHLMLAPALLRERQSEATVGFFFHIPFPAPEVWRMLPWARDIVEGLLGSDLIGFHCDEYADNFCAAAAELLGVEVDGHVIRYQDRSVHVETHPIGIDTERFSEMVERDEARTQAEHFKHDFKSDYLIVGVDRLDYTKGVPERLLAFEKFLQDNPDYHGRVSFYQIAAPSRTHIDDYQRLKREVDEIAGRINGAYMTDDWVPVRYLNRKHPQHELVGIYLAADIAMITPYRDGMNIVAQEFVWTSERGVLMLSHLTGAAEILEDALIVNPLDIGAVAEAIREGLELSEAERRIRLEKMRDAVERCDVHRWAEGFVDSLKRV
ncbi:MAG: trehalose-6-phosphate synthase [Trueperaceae bacterium]|nr:trehalose-6-phosphate synthase [Trueperaceae bacterium]